MSQILTKVLIAAFAQRGRQDEEFEDSDYSYEESDEDEGASEFYCEELYGYFGHDTYCDKYWSCDNGTETLKECGNGLMFDTRDNRVESCNYDYIVPCGTRNKKGKLYNSLV